MKVLSLSILFSIILACTSNSNKQKVSLPLVSPKEPKRIEFSNDTSFGKWDSLVLRYIYKPVSRNLTPADKEWYLIKDSAEEFSGFVNMKGDTVIPLKYGFPTFASDTFRTFTYVFMPERGIVAINKNEEVLFEPYFFDNSPDEVHEGLIRIKKGDKIGFADFNGRIVIEPIYDDAYWFENGYAIVGFKCFQDLVDDEHNPTICRRNGVINKKGELLFFSSNRDSVEKVYQKMTSH